MTAIGDRISQLSSAAASYAPAVGADGPTQLDNAHGARLALDEMTRLMLVASRTSTGGQVTSTTTANTVGLSTGIGLLASTRYQQSGQP